MVHALAVMPERGGGSGAGASGSGAGAALLWACTGSGSGSVTRLEDGAPTRKVGVGSCMLCRAVPRVSVPHGAGMHPPTAPLCIA